MALVLSPSGNLLLGPSGNLANSLDCCCDLCPCCGDGRDCNGTTYYLPFPGNGQPDGFIAFDFTFDITLCQNTCITPCPPHSSLAVGLGVSSPISVSGTLVAKYDTPTGSIEVPDPADICTLLLFNCGSWRLCQSSGTFPIQYKMYDAATCTGSGVTATTGGFAIYMAYDVPNLRFVLAIYLVPGSILSSNHLVFFGTHSFDARSKSAYAAFPLTFSNLLTSCECLCANPNWRTYMLHALATGGTFTLGLHTPCGVNCP